MDENNKDLTIPVLREELEVESIPSVTGGVRVTKHIESHDEIVEQELRKSNVQVKRISVNRPVDGPQSPRRVGNTLIVPVVSETLRVEKQWMVTEEIHLIETKTTESAQNTVTLNEERASIERLDSAGNVVPGEDIPERPAPPANSASILKSASARTGTGPKRKILNEPPPFRRGSGK
jgi:stress response protein YsnF